MAGPRRWFRRTAVVSLAASIGWPGAGVAASELAPAAGPTHVAEISSPPPADEVYPAGAVSPSGMWYVADSGQSRIVTANTAGFVAVLSSTAGGGWQHPKAIALDPDGSHLWVADTDNQRIVEIQSSDGSLVGTPIKSGINSPYGVAADASRVYVANTYGDQVRAYSHAGALLWSLSTCGGKAFGRVRGVAVGSNTDVYATDTDNGRIVEVDAATGTCIRAFGTKGKGPGQYNGPWALLSDGQGGLWVADSGNYRIEHVSNSGAFIAASSSSFGSGPNQFASLHCLFTVGARLGACDTDNHRIEIYTVGADGTPSYSSTTAFASPAPADFNQPVGVSFAANGDFYVTDSFNQRVVVCHSSSNTCDRTFGGFGTAAGSFLYPRGIEVVGSTVWVANSEDQRVDAFTLSGTFQKTYKPSGTTLKRDYAVAVDPADGSLWVTDTYHNRVVNYALDGTVQHSWTAGTTKPAGIAVDASGHVFVSDSGHNRVLSCTRAGSCAVLAAAGTAAGQVRNPTGLTIVGTQLYVADSNNNRIQVFTLTGAFVLQFGQGFLLSPRDAAVDPTGSRVYVTNFLNNSVSVWSL